MTRSSGPGRLHNFPRFISGLWRIGNGAEVPTAASVAGDERKGAVGNLGRTRNGIFWYRFPVAESLAPPICWRLFGEERRRAKVIPHAFGERTVMKLMFAAIIRATRLGEASR